MKLGEDLNKDDAFCLQARPRSRLMLHKQQQLPQPVHTQVHYTLFNAPLGPYALAPWFKAVAFELGIGIPPEVR